MKQVFNLNQGWLFSRSLPEDFSNRLPDAEKVNLPHTWNIVEDKSEGNDFYRGKCAYQKDLPVPAELRKIRLYLEFFGVNSVCELYIDGKLVGRHMGGFSTFRFEITPFVSYGKTNIITVTADNSTDEYVYPLSANYMPFGGIYRDVNLIIADMTHFALDDYGSPGIYVVPRVTKDGGKVGITAEVFNPVSYDIVSYTIYDSNGCAVGSAAVHPKNPDAIINIENPELWQGRLSPYLYTLKAKLIRDGEILDSEEISFGFRSIEVKEESGFYLNGTRTSLRGVTRYQDRQGCGWAMSEEQQREDIRIIKEMGANAIRLPYYQNDKYFYDLCDKEGIIVWTELPVVAEISTETKAKDNIQQQISEMVKQCYNHPSVCFFGIHSNIKNSESNEDIFDELSAISKAVKKIDKFLLTASANSMTTPVNSKINTIGDLVGYNVYLGWDGKSVDDFSGWIDSVLSEHAGISLAVSEYGAEGMVNYHSSDPVPKDYSEEYQALYHEKMWKKISEYDFLWASFASTMFDYALAVKNDDNDSYICHMGLVSYDRHIKKDAFYFYKSQWARQRFVRIAGSRYVVRTDRKTLVKIYSNCKSVSLVVNGKENRPYTSGGKNNVFEFEVRLVRGENIIKAITDEGLSDEIRIERRKLPEPSYALPEKTPMPEPEWEENIFVKENGLDEDVSDVTEDIIELPPEAEQETSENENNIETEDSEG